MFFATMTAAAEEAGSGLPRRVAQHLRRHGLGATLHRGALAVHALYREWRLGVRTRGSIDGSCLTGDPAAFGYQPIPYHSFDAALRHVTIQPGTDVFIDYGCGLGRAVVLAAMLPFRKVIGVELCATLCRDAIENVRRSRSHHRAGEVEIVNQDAKSYAVPDDATVFFLFNPFDESIVRCVLQRLRRSLDRRPRRVTIVYALPKCRRDLMAEIPWLRLKYDLKNVYSDWQRLVIYQAD